MKLTRIYYLLIVSIVSLLLAACNSVLGNQAVAPAAADQVAPVEEKTEAPAIELDEAEVSPLAAKDTGSAIAADTQATSPEAELSSLIEEGLVASVPTGNSLQPQLAQANIDLNDVVTLLPPDAIRAVDPEDVPDIMVTAEEANELGMKPDVRVMGVSINGESHAYPIPFLSRHEIVNTELGGRLIAATW